jgi:transcriptional regulator GlxA family with amidase domain
MLKDVVAVVGDQIAAFELGTVSEVFGLDRSDAGLPTYDFAVAGLRPGPVPTTSGWSMLVEHGLERLATADLVAIPAWPTGTAEAPPAELVDALHAAAERGAWLLSVCSGSFLLAAAGLLDGRRATTHWKYTDLLATRHPRVTVDPDVLYVVDGRVISSAGTAAGIDACLHLVRLEQGGAVANAIARRMVVPPHRNGGQAQYVEAPVPDLTDCDELAELLDWVTAHLDEPLTVDALAARALMSPRTFARRFRALTGTTPHRWLLDQRLLLAERLLEDTTLGIDVIADRAGLGSADSLRHHFAGRRGISPQTYRRTFRRSAAA